MSSSAKVVYLRCYGDRDRDDHPVVGAGVPHADVCVYFGSTAAIVEFELVGVRLLPAGS